YIAPEGPGTAQADLYSLGIVLYQMSTGKSHQAFPEPIDDLAARPDHTRWLEFNAVIHKACCADVLERYRSAQEMRSDLELLERGESVRRAQLLARIWRIAVRSLSFVAAAAAVVMAWSMFRVMRQPSVAQDSIKPSTNDLAQREFYVGRNFYHNNNGGWLEG